MEMRGETEIQAPRAVVWAALNNPDVLARAIDGVERLEQESDSRFAGTLAAAVGPVKAKFSGTVELTERDPPHRYVLVGEGKGGVAGFVKGRAEVVLTETAGGGTLLSYTAQSQVGGKLAQLGTRLIEGTARGYADRFFARLKEEVETPAAPPPAPAAAPEEAAAPALEAAAETAGLPPSVWLTALVVLVVLLLLFLWR